MSAGRTVALVCHPGTPEEVVRGIEVAVRRTPRGLLALGFRLDGEVSRLRVPAPAPPRSAPRLWEQTCFEAFVAVEGSAAYHELNLSPSGEWAVHAFRGYRDGGFLDDESLRPSIAVRLEAGALVLEAEIALERLSADYASAPLRLGLATVVERVDGGLSYWALNHPAATPDFHPAEARALLLEAPATEC